MRHPLLRRFILEYLRQRKWSAGLAAVCLTGAILTELAAPWPLKLIFDHLLLAKPWPASVSVLSGLQQWRPVPLLLALAGVMFALVVAGGLMSYVQVYLTTRAGYELAAGLRQELFSHIQRLSLAFHTRARAGELLLKVSSDTTALREAFSDWGARSAYQFLMVGGMLVVMTVVNWRLSLVVLASLPVLGLILTRLNASMRVSVARQRKQEGRIAARMSEVFGSIALVQAFGRHDFEDGRFRDENTKNLTEGIRTARTSAAVTRVIELVCAASTAITVIVGSWQALQGYMTPGDLLVFVSYLRLLYKPVRDLGKVSIKMSRAAVSADRVEESLALEPGIRDRLNPVIATGLRGEIVFQNVSFAYETGRQVLDDVSFHVQPGRRVVLVGASGAGKSSLISLLVRLHEPQAGTILIDGIDITHYQRDSLRREIGLVLQDTALFEGTIRDNIAYGKPEASELEIHDAARQANAHEFIMTLPQGYQTNVGERGCMLSGGQRQRICLARALVKRPSMLILDEPTSAIDPASATLIRSALERFRVGRSVLIISHQLPAAVEPDQVLVLRNHKILEELPITVATRDAIA